MREDITMIDNKDRPPHYHRPSASVDISHWNKDERKEKMLMRFMERMELNVNNPPEKRNRFVNELKVAFLRRLENHLYTLDSE